VKKRRQILNKVLISGGLEDFLKDYQERLENVHSIMKKSLKKAPAGSLKIVKKRNGLQFYYRKAPSDKQGRYLNKNEQDLVVRLAQKKYDLGVEKLLAEQKNSLEKMLNTNKEDAIRKVYEGLPRELQAMIEPAVMSPEKLAQMWQEVEYKRPSLENAASDLLTLRGEQVRSKSEIMIADALFHAKVPYRYEFPVYVRGRGTFHPDFLCLNKRTGKEVIWEHFGLMDNPEYAANALEKITLYAQNGFVLGRGFIYTMETLARPLSSRLVKQLIEVHFL
jgi:hypothetical protein